MEQPEQQQVVVLGADGQPVGQVSVGTDGSVDPARQQSPADQISEPAKVMRIGSMVKQLLEEVRAAPLDDAARTRLREVHERSITELADGLAPELREELDRLTLPFGENAVPSDAAGVVSVPARKMASRAKQNNGAHGLREEPA